MNIAFQIGSWPFRVIINRRNLLLQLHLVGIRLDSNRKENTEVQGNERADIYEAGANIILAVRGKKNNIAIKTQS